MKRFSLIAAVILLSGMMVSSAFGFALIDPATNQPYIGPVKFKFSDRSVGREYYPAGLDANGLPQPGVTTYTPETTGTWMPAGISKGLTPSVNTLTDSVMGTGDLVEDTWAGLYVTGIMDPADESRVFWSPSATEQISGVMWGFDDVMISAGGSNLLSTQGSVDLWLDNPQTGTAFKWDSSGNSLAYDEYTPGGHGTASFNTATDGTLFLSLDAVGGIVTGATDLGGKPVTRSETVNSLTTPWSGSGSMYLDVVGGTYMGLFDQDVFNVDKNGNGVIAANEWADFYVSFNFHTTPLSGENAYGMDGISDDPALAVAGPEPCTMLLLGSGLLGMGLFGRRRFKL